MSNSGIVAEMFIRNDSVYGAEIWLRNDAFLDQALRIGLISNESSLWRAVHDNDVRAVQSALDRGVDPSSSIIVPCEGAKKFFAESGIRDLPNEREVSSEVVAFDAPVSILMYAVVRSTPAIVSMLVSAGADVNFVGVGRQTAFQFMLELRRAFESKEREDVLHIGKNLLRAGANVNRVDDFGNTILLSAADNHQSDVVKMLVENGADVNWCGSNDISPLHHAISNQDKELADYLITHGANINTKDSAGKTALMIAAANGYTQCLELLLERCADAREIDNNGCTALDLMAQFDWSNSDTSYCRNRESERAIQELLYKYGARYKALSHLNESFERKFASVSQVEHPNEGGALVSESEDALSSREGFSGQASVRDSIFQLAYDEISNLRGYEYRSGEEIENYGNKIVERYLKLPKDVVSEYCDLSISFEEASRLVINIIADNRKIDLENRSEHAFIATSKTADYLHTGLALVIVLFPIKPDLVKMFIQVSSIKSTLGARKRNENMLDSVINAVKKYIV